ncbi:MAG TPA: hypothetical protein VFS25_17475 [Chitinophaga sp.]|uniref:HvfA family oxazolone/thioamide-modified RiPP metallophore n=1 Tax=Chitinophaga sp. TaxID=1869181 RepID=UPI002DB851A3|nr:hypothetical protein [Chitinophaga sp.]HEU4554641.1 hypothetical protein [Chitinophaga sp.]
MENKKKVLLTSSLLAGALLATANMQANAADLFRFNNLGNGEAVRTRLMDDAGHARTMELNCGAKKDSTSMKKGKDGKCGEGKCGEGKCGDKKSKTKMKKADSTKVKPAAR